MTYPEIKAELDKLVTDYEKRIADLTAENTVLKTNQLPTGIVNITITGINKDQVSFS